MRFADWVRDHATRDGEALTRTLMRLSGDWGVSYKTLFYASRGARVSPDLALSIETHTAGGVKASDLVMCPPRASLRRRPPTTRKRKPPTTEAA